MPGRNEEGCVVMKKEKKEKVKKPIYKKWWFWVLVVILVGGIGSGLSDDKSVAPAGQGETSSVASVSEPSEISNSDPVETTLGQDDNQDEKREALNEVLGGSVLLYENVRNDTTGRWRTLVFYSSENILDHAVEYYDAYFSSDDEVHFAVNLGLKTTSVMTVGMGMMFTDVHEYVDGEEHDAKTLGGGDLLKQYMVNLETGEIDDLDYAPTNDGGSVSLSGLEAAILATLPVEYQSSRWLNIDCDYNDAGISAYIQVDQGNDDADAALSLAADCFILAKNVVEDHNATFVQAVVIVVNDGASLGVYSTENGKDFDVLSGGKRTEVSLP